MRIILLINFLFFFSQTHSQLVAKSSLKDSLLFKSKIKGGVKQILKWSDKLGTNYLLLSETPEISSKEKLSSFGEECEDGCTDKELYAYHFVNGDSLLWKLMDFQKACSFDIAVEFRNGATKITDLDSNGIAETWVMYSLTCTSDVSPRTLKLVMHQGSKKYIVRGTSQPAKRALDKENGGKYIPDVEFASLPKAFKEYARKLWLQHLYDMP